MCRYNKVAIFVKKGRKMLDRIKTKKQRFLSEYDGKPVGIIRNLLPVEKMRIVCYTIHAQNNLE